MYKPILLGKHGSPASHTEYERVLGEWRAAQEVAFHLPLPSNGQPADLPLYEIALAFDKHAEHFSRNPTTGEPTGEADNLKDAHKPMRGWPGRRSTLASIAMVCASVSTALEAVAAFRRGEQVEIPTDAGTTRHSKAFLGQLVWPRKLQHLPA